MAVTNTQKPSSRSPGAEALTGPRAEITCEKRRSHGLGRLPSHSVMRGNTSMVYTSGQASFCCSNKWSPVSSCSNIHFSPFSEGGLCLLHSLGVLASDCHQSPCQGKKLSRPLVLFLLRHGNHSAGADGLVGAPSQEDSSFSGDEYVRGGFLPFALLLHR